MMKKIAILLTFSIISQFLCGQSPTFSFYQKKNPNAKPIVYYYPYYNHTQLIIIDYNEYRYTSPPSAIDHVYLAPEGDVLIRNEEGVILKHYKIKTYHSPSHGGVWYHPAQVIPAIPPLLSPEKSEKEALTYQPVHFSPVTAMVVYDSTSYNSTSKTTGAMLIDKEGNEIPGTKYDNIIPDIINSCYLVEKDGKWGILSSEYKEVRAPEFIYLSHSYGNYNILDAQSTNGKFGLVDSSGKTVLPCVYDEFIGQPHEGFIQVKSDRKIGFINRQYVEVVKPKYDEGTSFFENGYARARLNGKYGIIDTTGKEIISIKYDNIGKLEEGMISVLQDGKWGFLNIKEKVIIPFIYENQPADFHDGLAKTYKQKADVNRYEFAFIDHTGNVIMKCEYKNASEFSEGMVRVENDQGLYGFLDKKGKEVIACSYYYVEDFKNSKAKVHQENGKTFFINKNGKVVPE